jgi:GT2 family glycosyltransferase
MATHEAEGPRVAAVVVNWRRPAATRTCLDALAAVGAPGCMPIVVENGSADFTDDEIERRGGGRVVSAANVGFAAGANLGMQAALARGADWVWFVNDDAAPEPGALAILLDAAQRRPFPQLLGPKIVQAHRPDRIDSIAIDLDLADGRVALLGHDEVDRGQYDALAVEPLAVTGCALLVSRAACAQLGGFEEAYYAYFEDIDFCLRARLAGLPLAVVPAARVRHDRLPAHAGRQSAASLYYSVRNHLVVVEAALADEAPHAAYRRPLSRVRRPAQRHERRAGGARGAPRPGRLPARGHGPGAGAEP